MTDRIDSLLLDSATAQLQALEQGSVSARELLGAHLARIERLDGRTNAVCTLAPERAQAEALRIDEARANGQTVGPLAGLPVTIKDAIATAGIRSTGGATELADFIPTSDATAVRRIREAGALVFGKTNLPRWSGDYQSYNELFGTTNNPWNLACTPGGSSGGAAAAVAMGFTSFEIGTDIGGSVRVPASFSGVLGHKPSFGIIPTHGYLDHRTHHRSTADVNVFGPMARSIDDLDLLLSLLAGPSDDDAPAWRLELPSAASTLANVRVAAWLDDPACPLDPAVTSVMERAVAALEAAGASIDHEARPPFDADAAARLGQLVIGAAAGISDDGNTEEHRRQFGHIDLEVLRRQRDAVRQGWHHFFTDVDILLCPIMCVPPFEHVHAPSGSNFSDSVLADFGDRPYVDMLWWCALTGSAYLPVTTTPIGWTENGVPIGIQIVAPYLHDRAALAFARAAGDVWGGFRPPPLALS